jgi:hypothetical protein
MPLSINYRITGLGLAECAVADSSSSCTITASYFSDALRHLVLAGTAVLSGFKCVSFSFEEEPGEYRWVIKSPRTNEIELQVIEFDSAYSEKLDAEGQLLFRTICLPIVFGQAVQKAASEVLASLGEAGYAEQWSEHLFPTAQLVELSRLLAEQERDA